MSQKNFSEMTDAEMSNFVNQQLNIVGNGDIPEATACADLFEKMGGVSGIHVRNAGEPKMEFTTRQTLEWYVGQFIDIVENRSWFAINSFVNAIDKFSPIVH